ncbi:MAG: hypothetical protein ACFB50_15715 [Rubrobacteraceae bacterium]
MSQTTPDPRFSSRSDEVVVEKHGSLFDGALTDEVLDSSKRVLSPARGNGATVGLQQWFSPPEAAELIASVFGSRYSTPAAVLDPTAGAGALLAPYRPESRFGIEIDADHVRNAKRRTTWEAKEIRTKTASEMNGQITHLQDGSDGTQDDGNGSSAGVSYRALQGDAQKVVPMLRATGVRFPAVVLNPPFGLGWNDAVHAGGKADKEINSTVLAYLWALDLLKKFGQGAMICGTNKLAKDILSRPEGRGVYAVADVEGPLFDGVSLPTSIAFFMNPEDLRDQPGVAGGDPSPRRFTATRAGLPHLAVEIQEYRNCRAHYTSTFCSREELDHILSGFAAVAQEHERRRKAARAKKPVADYDIDLAGKKISISLNAYTRLALANSGRQTEVQLLANNHISYFGQNKRSWRQLETLEGKGLLSISPALRAAAEKVVEEAEAVATPLWPVKPQMRLGWLTDLDKIVCKKGDARLGFVAGETYPLSTESKVASETEERVVENRRGTPELRRFTTQRRLLEVRIGSHSFDEGNENIEYLTDRFEFPDPGCVATKFPDLVRDRRNLLRLIERKNNFELRGFQIDHLSRLLVKERGMLAHDPGLGKTLQLMVLAEAHRYLGAAPQALFLTMQDLLRQWSAECKKFFGRRFEIISSPGQARRVADRVERGEVGWWLTYYECLSVVGRKKELLPHTYLDPADDLARRLAVYKRNKRIAAGVDTSDVKYPPMKPTTRDACPECGADTSAGWTGEVCAGTEEHEGCGYTRRSVYVKTAVSHLTRAFNKGVTCVDEVAEIRGDDSLKSKAVRALGRGPHKYGATGTPMCNFVSDSFIPLQWSLGAGTISFPYDYGAKGRASYEQDFCVIEHLHGREEDGEQNQKQRRKILPKVTNVSQFWRLTQPTVSRCRKEQTGEPIVPKTYYPIRVPLGVGQQKANAFWLDNFAQYFCAKNPDHPMVKHNLVDRYAAALGQRWRMEHAATLPAADEPSREWSKAKKELGELSNYTPAALKVLEITLDHVRKGEKVLIGSDLIMTGLWLSERLSEKGVRPVHITEEKAGKVATKNPRKRAAEVEAFAAGDAEVLCSGIGAMKLGHNLTAASCVVLHGLPDSYMHFFQFLERVHRLTSENPVSVYVVIPNGSLAEKKWQLLKDKGGTSDLAYDGELSVQPEKPIDWNEVLREMKEQGIAATGNEVLEADVEAAWGALDPVRPLFAHAKPRPALSPGFRVGPQPEYVQGSLFDLTG